MVFKGADNFVKKEGGRRGTARRRTEKLLLSSLLANLMRQGGIRVYVYACMPGNKPEQTLGSMLMYHSLEDE